MAIIKLGRRGTLLTLSIEELKQKYSSEETQTNILRLVGIGNLLSTSIVVPRYRIPSHLHEPIQFTALGQRLVRELLGGRRGNWGEARMAVFLEMYYDDLFIDPDDTDITALRRGFSREIVTRSIRHPFIFGRELYDKAFETLDVSSLTSISPTESLALLDDTPCGVFQSFDTVVGPYGALKSAQIRSIEPTFTPRLYHCERPGCLTGHKARLRTSENSILSFRERLRKKLTSRGRSADWSRYTSEISTTRMGYFDDRRAMNYAALLGECFDGDDVRSIFVTALTGRRKDFRALCASVGVEIRGAEEFAATANKAEMMQLLLLLPDQALTSAIDCSVRSASIKIPTDEIRTPRLNPGKWGYFGSVLQCSTRGVRVSSSIASVPIERLHRLVLAIADESPAHVAWKLRQVQGNSVEQKIQNYMHAAMPRTIIEELLLSGPDVFAIAAEECGLPPEASEDNDQLVADFLWKLGFKYESLSSDTQNLRTSARSLLKEAARHSSYGEEEREAIRSRSSNSFVSLERMLDQALCFSCWLTTYDHWLSTPRFTFFPDEARRHTANLLTAESTSRGNSVTFMADGGNTLFPLISGFGILAAALENYSAQSSSYHRDERDFPTHYAYSRLLDFGYKYTIPFLNFSRESQSGILDSLRTVARELSTGNVMNTRNSLEHHRDEFPSYDQIDRSVAAMIAVCDLLEGTGLLPIKFGAKNLSRDEAGRFVYTYRDYSGREIEMRRPSLVTVSGTPPVLNTQIIVPSVKLDHSTEYARFSTGYHSSYTEMWKGWPRSRIINRTAEDHLDQTTSDDELALDASGF
jgi:hypothetical protein